METDALAKILWEYNLLHHKLHKADAILVLGSNDLRVAEHGARLYKEGWAPLILFSGNTGRLTESWKQTEAEAFADVAERYGVPRSAMLLEPRSTNTEENIVFVKKLLGEKGISANRFILVTKPYMERRAYATFKKQWPEAGVSVSTPPLSYESYPNEDISKDEMVHILVGDTERIKVYAEKGFQIPQEIPQAVWDAYEALVAKGYTKYLVS
jgi:uncharacterized SAM-binding protein YcdF (DUF218 family)